MLQKPLVWRDDEGSAVVEFTFVAVLLSVLTLAVIQLALGLHVRNTVLDAAAEGARHAALADNTLADGAARTRELISTAIGPSYATQVTARNGDFLGHPSTEITVSTTLPLIGLIGIADGLEVSGHAALETAEE
ncbi:pilus assembly protein [Okibacterium endophyticum]